MVMMMINIMTMMTKITYQNDMLFSKRKHGCTVEGVLRSHDKWENMQTHN